MKLLPFANLRQTLRDRRLAARDPQAFAISLGVRIRGTVRFYGIDRGMFGSEPWLISFGDNVYVTAGVRFITHDGGTLILRKEVPDLEWTAPISIGNDVYLGINSIVLPGVSIGNRCIVAAGAVVSNDVAGNTVVGGVPARVITSVDHYLEKMEAKSLRLGHLHGLEKQGRLKHHFGIE